MNNSNAFKDSRVKNNSTLNKYRSMSESHLSKNKNYSDLFKRERKKKVSIVHKNNDVIFPK